MSTTLASRILTLHVVASLGGLASACSGADPAADPSLDAATAADTAHPRDPQKNCIKPGTKNNEKGVGGYCEPGTSDCVSGTVIGFCTGAFAQTPPDSWFCTRPCATDSECGSGAYCEHDKSGSGCVPNVCGTPPDAGASDASTADAPASDASTLDATKE